MKILNPFLIDLINYLQLQEHSCFHIFGIIVRLQEKHKLFPFGVRRRIHIQNHFGVIKIDGTPVERFPHPVYITRGQNSQREPNNGTEEQKHGYKLGPPRIGHNFLIGFFIGQKFVIYAFQDELTH